jgi:hypothetical protein
MSFFVKKKKYNELNCLALAPECGGPDTVVILPFKCAHTHWTCFESEKFCSVVCPSVCCSICRLLSADTLSHPQRAGAMSAQRLSHAKPGAARSEEESETFLQSKCANAKLFLEADESKCAAAAPSNLFIALFCRHYVIIATCE